MSTDHANPGPLDEETMLAWIEGTLPPTDHRAVSERLREDPILRTRLDAMRLDRFHLSAMGDIPAPAGLLDGVADLLERDMLVGMEDGEAFAREDLALPEPVGHPSHEGLRRVHRPRRLRIGRGLALAAVIVIVGAGAWVGGMLSTRGHAPATPGTPPLALEQGRDLASAVHEAGVPDETKPDTPTVASATQEVEIADAGSEHDGAIIPPAARMADRLDLLREGRLVLRVRLADLSGLSWIDEVAQRVPIRRDAPADLIASLAPANEAVRIEREPARLLAGDRQVGPPVELSMQERPAVPRRVLASVVLVDLPLDDRSLDEAIRGLRSHRGIVRVEIDESPVALSGGDASDEDPFWWRRPSEQWRPRATVPIVFEVLE